LREGTATRLVARMQPLRAFQIVYLVMVLALGAKLGERVLRRSAWRWGAAMLLLGGAMLGAERGAFPNSNHLELPGVAARNQWVQAFVWVRGNTPQGALFALDADYINAAGEDAQCFGRSRSAARCPTTRRMEARRLLRQSWPARGQRAGRAAGAEPEQQECGRGRRGAHRCAEAAGVSWW